MAQDRDDEEMFSQMVEYIDAAYWTAVNLFEGAGDHHYSAAAAVIDDRTANLRRLVALDLSTNIGKSLQQIGNLYACRELWFDPYGLPDGFALGEEDEH